MNPFMAN